MTEFLEGLGAGGAAILNTACLLPLYPGLIAFLAGNANDERARRVTGRLGLLVLVGILTMMLAVGVVVYLLQGSFDQVFPVVLPLVYGLVIVLGAMMLADRSPFARLSSVQSPVLSSPYATAYVYGLLFGPMALPCIGPFITASLALGAKDAGSLVSALMYFFGFGLGFGWPLVILPLMAQPAQRRFVGWMTRNHRLLNRASGVLLIAVGLFGILTELLPRWISGIEVPQESWWLFWAGAAVVMVAVGVYTHRRSNGRTPSSA